MHHAVDYCRRLLICLIEALKENESFSIIPGNTYDEELSSHQHESPPASSISSLDISPQETGETRHHLEDSLDGSEISVGRLYTRQTDCSEHSDSEPVATDIQMNQTDSQNTFTPYLSQMPSDSQIQSNGGLPLSFPVIDQDLDLPHLQPNTYVSTEWQIDPFDTTKSMCNHLTLPCTESAPVGVGYGSLQSEWSLSAPGALNSLFTPREPFEHWVPNLSLNDPQYAGFNHGMYYPSLYACGDQQSRQYQNYTTFCPTMPPYDPIWAATDIAPFGKSYFGHNFAIT